MRQHLVASRQKPAGIGKRADDIRMKQPTESKEQASLIEWWDLLSSLKGIDESMLFAIPNGGARTAITGARLKKEGVRPGIPDLFLAIPTKGFPGMFIEMKRKGGRATPTQVRMHNSLRSRGYAVACCRGWEEARDRVWEYLK